MTLYLKHRPQSLDQIRGNPELVSTLDNMLSDPKTCPHVFLLHGPTGCGKTTIARIIGTRLGCTGYDLREVDSADFRGIDSIREIRKQSQFRPLESPCRMWILDEVHKNTNDAQNALLKILEDTPPHVYFVLCTTDPHKLLPTIRGRCSQFQVMPLSDRQMNILLHRIVKAENAKVMDAVYEQIIRDSFGLPRNALQTLDQVLRVPEEEQLETARRSEFIQSESIELCRALIAGERWIKIMKILEGLKDQDVEGIRRHVLGYCQGALLKGESDQAAHIIEQFWDPFFNIGFPGLVFACYSTIKT